MASGRQPQRGFPPMKTQRRKETLLADSREWRQADISTECLGQQLLIRGRWHVMGAVPPRRCHCGGVGGGHLVLPSPTRPLPPRQQPQIREHRDEEVTARRGQGSVRKPAATGTNLNNRCTRSHDGAVPPMWCEKM